MDKNIIQSKKLQNGMNGKYKKIYSFLTFINIIFITYTTKFQITIEYGKFD